MLKQKPLHHGLLILSLLLYLLIGYGVERHETVPLLVSYLLLFFFYVLLINHADYKTALSAAILYRVALLFCVPELSDDFYRFIWDGRLLAAGHHPFTEVPSYYMSQKISVPGINAELYQQLNSKENFTIYPPVAQFIFWLSVKLSPQSLYGSMLVMKLIILSFELGTFCLLTKIIQHFNQPRGSLLIYALNPLVVLELTGNLHFEGIMIFFLFLALFFLIRDRHIASCTAYALSVCTKLIPLIFLPLLARHLGWTKTGTYWGLTGVFCILLFLPLLNADIIRGFSTSLGYYFQRFEFNASIYYLIREAGYLAAGFNIIHIAGPAMAFIAFCLIIGFALRGFPQQPAGVLHKRFFTDILLALFIYFLLTTTLHPWYVITMVALCVFTPYRFPVVWSCLIFLTYAGYAEDTFRENLAIVALEYVIVIGYFLYETVWAKRINHS